MSISKWRVLKMDKTIGKTNETTGRRRKRETRYVTIVNSMFEDERLSLKAKGLLGYLLTKPDGWKVRIKDLMNHCSDGERSIRSGIKELKEFGYLTFYRTRDKGSFSGIVWEYDDVPFVMDPDEKPDTEPFEPEVQNSNVEEIDHNVQNAVVANEHEENIHMQDRLYISNRFKDSNQDFNNYDYDYQSIIAPQVQEIFVKVFGYPNEKNSNALMDRLIDVMNSYYFFHTQLTLIDLQRILFQIKTAENKKPIKEFRSYLYKSFETAVKQIIQAKKEESRKENLPDWFYEQKEQRLDFMPKQNKELSDEEKEREIKEILKEFRKK